MAQHWIEKWQNNNWITCSGETVVSKDLWLELEEAINRFGFGRISWRHVPKHCGNFGNMQADRLAKEAASEATDDESDSDDDYEDYSNGYSDDYDDYNDYNGYDGSDDWYLMLLSSCILESCQKTSLMCSHFQTWTHLECACSEKWGPARSDGYPPRHTAAEDSGCSLRSASQVGVFRSAAPRASPGST